MHIPYKYSMGSSESNLYGLKTNYQSKINLGAQPVRENDKQNYKIDMEKIK
jgi:hypothetical protein